ncbi:hypothetical protein E4T48_05193 [Aureobasidium sp. EXF-10727]|nr:hypothetical protein E4T48_05193 [Aureobasidium sp. EXF-10727]KAI4723962.1 hypothetical protein E4T49_08305 [Aureobasidium sp. EXF-10728]
MPRPLISIALLAFLTSTANAAACSLCPISITYTTPSGCLALNCLQPTCTVTTTTTIPTSYCSTKTRTACPRSCAPCSTETITEQEDPIVVQPTISPSDSTTTTEPNTTVNPGGPIVISPTEAPSSTAAGDCAPYTVTTTATNPACTFDTSDCIRPLCVIETTTTVPACGVPVTETELAVCPTACPAGCATFVYTTSAMPTSSAALD